MKVMMLPLIVSMLSICCSISVSAGEFLPPRQVLTKQGPVDVQRTGHSAPFVGDIDGDGKDDLLVGEFYEGRMRTFRNLGTNEKPHFDRYEWFKCGAELGRVPTG